MASSPRKDNKKRHRISQKCNEKEHHKHNELSTIKGKKLSTLNQASLEDGVTESSIEATYGSMLDVRGSGGYIINALTGDKGVTKMRLPICGGSRYMTSYRTGLG